MRLRNKLIVFSALTMISGGAASSVAAQEVFRVPIPPPALRSGNVMMFGGGSYIGVQTENISRENFAKYNLTEPRGVAVTNVVAGSPAKQAGLQKGDVIIAFDNEEVKSDVKLMRLIGEVAPDQKVELTILRGGAEQRISVTVAKREMPALPTLNGFNIPAGANMRVLTFPPSGSNLPLIAPSPAPNEDNVFVVPGGASLTMGVNVQTLSKQLGDFLGVADGKGLLITEVRENGAAAKSGFKAGDVIIEVDNASVATRTDLIRALNSKKDGVDVTIIRDKQRQILRLTPENNVQP